MKSALPLLLPFVLSFLLLLALLGLPEPHAEGTPREKVEDGRVEKTD